MSTTQLFLLSCCCLLLSFSSLVECDEDDDHFGDYGPKAIDLASFGTGFKAAEEAMARRIRLNESRQIVPTVNSQKNQSLEML